MGVSKNVSSHCTKPVNQYVNKTNKQPKITFILSVCESFVFFKLKSRVKMKRKSNWNKIQSDKVNCVFQIFMLNLTKTNYLTALLFFLDLSLFIIYFDGFNFVYL